MPYSSPRGYLSLAPAIRLSHEISSESLPHLRLLGLTTATLYFGVNQRKRGAPDSSGVFRGMVLVVSICYHDPCQPLERDVALIRTQITRHLLVCPRRRSISARPGRNTRQPIKSTFS